MNRVEYCKSCGKSMNHGCGLCASCWTRMRREAADALETTSRDFTPEEASGYRRFLDRLFKRNTSN